MNRILLNFSMFMLFVIASGNPMYGQIHDIKQASSDNQSEHSNSSSSNSSSDDSYSWDDDDDDHSSSNKRTHYPRIEDGGSYFLGFGYNKIYLDSVLIGAEISKHDIVLDSTEQYVHIERYVKYGPKLSIDLKALFDIGFHKGIDRNYIYVDYLPGFRVNLNYLLVDFRYNILTEYTDGYPDAFKSWELLFMLNIAADCDEFDFIMGCGIYREIWDEENYQFGELYLGTKFPLINSADFIDADIRLAIDPKEEEDVPDVFPFFEIGARYNKRFVNFDHLSGYITLGAIYQNYYQSHDIWALRGGAIFNWH